jgi:DNA polymerase-3 subunit delta
MVAVKAGRVEAFLARPEPAVRAFLIYGPDTGLVAERAQMLARTVVTDLDDPFNLSRLDDGTLSADPGLLADEARAQSLMGGRRVVWVRGAGAAFASALETYLADPVGDALIVAEAGDLKPSARLRKLCELSPMAAALPCYGDDSRMIDALISEEVRSHGLEITPAARERLAALLGADRQLSRNEVEKLCLYMLGQPVIEEIDVEAICGDAAASTLDEIIDATAEGDLQRLDSAYARALSAGVGSTSVVLAMSRHMVRLQTLRNSAGSARNFEQTVRGARPPIHFARAASIVRQLRLWSDDDLRRAIGALAGLEADSRLNAELADTLVGRALVGIAHNAYSLRRRMK